MIYKTKSLVLAEKVLLGLTDILNSPDSPAEYRQIGNVVQECYQNGREQGFIVWPLFASSQAFYVAQARRSDRIVVYFGAYSMQSMPESAYNHPNYFNHDEADKAANWIAEELVDLWLKHKSKES